MPNTSSPFRIPVKLLLCILWAIMSITCPQAKGAASAGSEPRIALVIGNNDYRYTATLTNAVADARALKQELEARHFRVVYRENADRRAMNDAIDEFLGKLNPQTIGIIYYSGHGVQISGANYLIPVDLQVRKPGDFANDAIELSRLLDRVRQARAKFTLAIIDACRDNPFHDGSKSMGAQGLSNTSVQGMMIVYAASTDQKALDRLSNADRDPNGLFTRELIKAMREPGLKIQDTFYELKQAVIAKAEAAGYDQTPTIYDESKGTFILTEGASQQGTQAASLEPVPVTRASGPFKDCSDCPEMVVIPSGSFMMGSPASEAGRYDEEGPQHQVSVRSYALGKTLVTQGQWRSLMGSNPNEFTNCGDNCPVEWVSWNDAQEYVRKLSAQSGTTYRLPSEAEWEYACRAGQQQLYCGSNAVDSVAWYDGNSGRSTHPVGQKQANAWGLYDMSGNVSEWTQDCVNNRYSGAPSDGTAWLSGSCEYRVLRGGSWVDSPQGVRSAVRIWGYPGVRVSGSGFRVARTLN